MEFPNFVYRVPGPYQRGGGTYSYLQVVDDADLSAALVAGWSATLGDAISPVQAEPVISTDVEPTRAEIEAKATELGIEFDGRSTDKTLLLKIEAALAGA